MQDHIIAIMITWMILVASLKRGFDDFVMRRAWLSYHKNRILMPTATLLECKRLQNLNAHADVWVWQKTPLQRYFSMPPVLLASGW